MLVRQNQSRLGGDPGLDSALTWHTPLQVSVHGRAAVSAIVSEAEEDNKMTRKS